MDNRPEDIREREVVREYRQDNGSGMGFFLGIILIIVLLILFFVYGLPKADRDENRNDRLDIDVNLPEPPTIPDPINGDN